MRVKTASFSEVGLVRKVNQDAILVKIGEDNTGDFAMLALADGMGGYSDGEVASSLAINELEKWWNESLPNFIMTAKDLTHDVKDELCEVYSKINKAILDYGETIQNRVGTTLSMMLIYNRRYIALHVGDSRIYELKLRVLRNQLNQITKDDSYIQTQIDAGKLTRKDAENHIKGNILTNCLGRKAFTKPQVYFGDIRKEVGFVLCSDGTYNHLTEKMLTTCLMNIDSDFNDSNIHLDKIREKIENQGAPDNLSLIFAKIEV